MNNNILKTISVEYIFGLEGFNNENTKKRISKVSPELLYSAQEIVDRNFKDILVSHPKERQIKLACLQYFFAIYLVDQISVINKVGYKARLKRFVTQHNQIEDLLDSLQNFDFCIGSCGIEAQNLCQQ